MSTNPAHTNFYSPTNHYYPYPQSVFYTPYNQSTPPAPQPLRQNYKRTDTQTELTNKVKEITDTCVKGIIDIAKSNISDSSKVYDYKPTYIKDGKTIRTCFYTSEGDIWSITNMETLICPDVINIDKTISKFNPLEKKIYNHLLNSLMKTILSRSIQENIILAVLPAIENVKCITDSKVLRYYTSLFIKEIQNYDNIDTRLFLNHHLWNAPQYIRSSAKEHKNICCYCSQIKKTHNCNIL